MIVVPADSEYQTLDDLIAAFQADPERHLLGRRLGRRHRPHPRRPDRPGGRGRPDADQLHPLLRRRRGAGGHPRRSGLGRRLRCRRVAGPDRVRRAARAGGLRLGRRRATPPRTAGARRGGRRRRSPDPARAGRRRRAGQLARHRRPARDLGRGPAVPASRWSSRCTTRDAWAADARAIRLAGLLHVRRRVRRRSSTAERDRVIGILHGAGAGRVATRPDPRHSVPRVTGAG